ncbi:thioredoxin [Anaerorhabdus sp.]|uniref:thioredoxin n=1 Tax=Anaerorhabdus sp. TaxID=1872524 RepID=UPI002B1F9B7F|nr:thioredoxin [Anaerorhabdus sp.]MEA4874400.1 thioredoxin [Anaerorhabdus sp.]
MKIIETVQEFDELLKNKPAVIVDFFAEWCGPCKMIAPVLEDLSKEHTAVEFVKVDVDALGELAQRYGVMSIPALFVFKNGEIVHNTVGFQAKPALEGLIKLVE